MPPPFLLADVAAAVSIVRADASLADLPIIMITSRIAEKHHDHARALGVNHYLGKPYAEDELLRLVRHYTIAEAPQAMAA